MSENFLDTPYRDSQAIFRDIDRAEQALLAERVALAERRAAYELRQRETRRAGPPFAALVLFVLPWWGLLCASLYGGWGWTFFGLNVLVVALLVALVRVTKSGR